MRKGAATYAASGSTAAPSLAAIAARAGWQLSQVLTKYIKHCDAGDHFVGRTVVGLPIHDEKFALMPPRFREINSTVTDVLLLCFPELGNPDKAHMFPIFEHCLASVIYHFDWLISHLPRAHPLFQTSLFLDRCMREQLDVLKSNVECKLATVNDAIQPTGIPPHVRQLIATKKIELELKDSKQELRELKDILVDLTNTMRANLPSVPTTAVVSSTGLDEAVRQVNERLEARFEGILTLLFFFYCLSHILQFCIRFESAC